MGGAGENTFCKHEKGGPAGGVLGKVTDGRETFLHCPSPVVSSSLGYMFEGGERGFGRLRQARVVERLYRYWWVGWLAELEAGASGPMVDDCIGELPWVAGCVSALRGWELGSWLRQSPASPG